MSEASTDSVGTSDIELFDAVSPATGSRFFLVFLDFFTLFLAVGVTSQAHRGINDSICESVQHTYHADVRKQIWEYPDTRWEHNDGNRPENQTQYRNYHQQSKETQDEHA